MLSLPVMAQRLAILAILVAALVGGAFYLMSRDSAPPPAAGVAPASPQAASAGPPPALPAGFPPVYPGASLEDSRSNTITGGWQRAFVYTSKARATDLIPFYRKSLLSAGMQMMAEGAGPYGGILRAQDAPGKRSVSVEVDAPEDQPNRAARITVTVTDNK